MNTLHIGRAWLPQATTITGLCLLIYVVGQQQYRQSLNDPQIQMAEDAAAALAGGAVPADIVPHGTPTVDIAESLAPWIVVYDTQGAPLESSAVLHGKPPQPPRGTFDPETWSLRKGRDNTGSEVRYTWQPEPNVRQALVMVRFESGKSSGFVVAGRNMREVELRQGTLFLTVAVLWGALMFAALALAFVFAWLRTRVKRP